MLIEKKIDLDRSMTEIKQIFYNLFWQDKACQNLFLLSKEELLDTKRLELESVSTSISLPRIIISNIQDKEDFNHKTIRFRNETNNIRAEKLLNDKIELYTPIITNFIESKFGKSLEKLIHDFENNPWKFLRKIFVLLTDGEENFEKVTIEFLQEYGFVGKHINSFVELESFFEKEAISKNAKSILSENNIWNFLEFLKSIKDIYVNESYRSLYNTSQVLVSALYDIDDFRSRLNLFSHLYESKIIGPSHEDSFIECVNCEPGTYRGVFQLKLNPRKLSNLKCPICFNELSYFVPYELHNDIYQIIKQKDGLLLDVLCDYLTKKNISFKTNLNLLKDIELDCSFQQGNKVFLIECKMYKQTTTYNKLKNKIREHFGKLLKDAERIDLQETSDIIYIPILLVNILNTEFITILEDELKKENIGDIAQRIQVMNVSMLNKLTTNQ